MPAGCRHCSVGEVTEVHYLHFFNSYRNVQMIPHDEYDLAAALLRAMAHPGRLEVLDLLAAAPRTVGELIEATRQTSPGMSQQLRVLRDAGVVRARRDGRFVVYAVAHPAVGHLVRDVLTHVGGEVTEEQPKR